jgi:hypothetical protein
MAVFAIDREPGRLPGIQRAGVALRSEPDER